MSVNTESPSLVLYQMSYVRSCRASEGWDEYQHQKNGIGIIVLIRNGGTKACVGTYVDFFTINSDISTIDLLFTFLSTIDKGKSCSTIIRNKIFQIFLSSFLLT